MLFTMYKKNNISGRVWLFISIHATNANCMYFLLTQLISFNHQPSEGATASVKLRYSHTHTLTHTVTIVLWHIWHDGDIFNRFRPFNLHLPTHLLYWFNTFQQIRFVEYRFSFFKYLLWVRIHDGKIQWNMKMNICKRAFVLSLSMRNRFEYLVNG